MNFGLAREIYGLNAWCVDSITFPALTAILKNVQNNVSLEIPDVKYNSISLYDFQSKETRLISDTWQLRNDNDFEGVGVINLNGAITKNGGASSNGTKELSSQMLRMANDNRIKGFILKVDSGGGASNAVSILVDTINEIKATKPVYTLVEKGGVMASAAYGIGSAGQKIYAEDNMSTVGSIGTMIAFEGKKSGTVDKNGYKNIVLYATKSTKKNEAFNEAIDNDNYELLVNDLLDPINENFIAQTLANRPQLSETKFDNGHTVFSKDAIGTFIDGIASFEEVVSMILNTNNNLNINSNSKIMTKSDFKSQFPDAYQEVVSEGIAQEQERVASWMAYSEADPKAVSEGIASGLEISKAQSHNFLVKMAQKGKLEDLQSDNAPTIVTNGTPTELQETSEHDKEIESAFNFKL
jgi:ClpP class serine protease